MKFGNHNWEKTSKIPLPVHNGASAHYQRWYCNKCNTIITVFGDQIFEWSLYEDVKNDQTCFLDGPPPSCEEVRMEDALT